MLVAPGTMPGPTPMPGIQAIPSTAQDIRHHSDTSEQVGCNTFCGTNTLCGTKQVKYYSWSLFWRRGGGKRVAFSGLCERRVGCCGYKRMQSSAPNVIGLAWYKACSVILKWMGAHGSTEANLIVAVRAKYNKTNAILNYSEWWTNNKITFKVGLW